MLVPSWRLAWKASRYSMRFQARAQPEAFRTSEVLDLVVTGGCGGSDHPGPIADAACHSVGWAGCVRPHRSRLRRCEPNQDCYRRFGECSFGGPVAFGSSWRHAFSSFELRIFHGVVPLFVPSFVRDLPSVRLGSTSMQRDSPTSQWQ
jgi:hypothetical protein